MTAGNPLVPESPLLSKQLNGLALWWGGHAFFNIPLESDHPSRATLERVERGLSQFSANPKLIVWGAHDFCFNDHFLKRWKYIFPDADVFEMKDAGHYVLDDGGQPARSRITTFIKTA